MSNWKIIIIGLVVINAILLYRDLPEFKVALEKELQTIPPQYHKFAIAWVTFATLLDYCFVILYSYFINKKGK